MLRSIQSGTCVLVFRYQHTTLKSREIITMILPAFLAEGTPKNQQFFCSGGSPVDGWFAPLMIPIASDDALVDTGQYMFLFC